MMLAFITFHNVCGSKKCSLGYLINVPNQRSHSLHMFSIKIDTKSHELFNNIKLTNFASHIEGNFH